MNAGDGEKFIVAVDVGTTTIRSCLYDQACKLRFYNERPISLIYGSDGGTLHVEMEPENLWTDFKELVAESISKLSDPDQIAGLSLCCQRNSFISWNRQTLAPLHRIITWKDCRAIAECERWNNSCLIKMLNLVGKVAFFFTRSERFRAAGFYRFVNAMVSHRFMKTLEKDIGMQRALGENNLQLATLDAWLISKLTNGHSCFTEPSNASATGLYDPFTLDWGHAILKLIGFPPKTLPIIHDSAGRELCYVDKDIFGVEMPILSVLGDSQSAAIGAGCYKKDMVKISLGTGTFINVVSDRPYASLSGVYPLVGWSLAPKDVTYMIESRANDTATCLKWALSIGLYDAIEETSNYTNEDADQGLCFVPAFGGMQTPQEDNNACAGFLGLHPHTTKKQMMFAVVESLAFKVKQICDTFASQRLFPKVPVIRLCGGVSQNDFICQQIANLLQQPVERVEEPGFCGAKGAAILGGLTAGLWSIDDIAIMTKVNGRFEPEADFDTTRYELWIKAVDRCSKFY